MVIGKGLLAKTFSGYEKDDNILIFASGISNSSSFEEKDQVREKDLLIKTISTYPEKILIYFSTCSIYDKTKNKDPYIKHKIEIEEIIKHYCKHYLIFRITNLIGKTNNKSTFLNYFIDKILNEEGFKIWKYSKRNIIDAEDMEKICSYIIKCRQFQNTIINIASPYFFSIEEIVRSIEIHLNIKGYYSITDKGGTPEFNNEICIGVSKILGINFDETYFKNILKKYYLVDELQKK